MIKILKRNEIDEVRWNDLVSKSAEGNVFAYTWYLDACSPEWIALIKDDYEAILPLACRKKAGIIYSYLPFFVRYFTVIAKQASTSELRKLFINSIPSNIRYIDFCLHESQLEIPEDSTSEHKKYQFLNLRNKYTDIRSRYNENLSRNLKKAEKASLSIFENYNSTDVVEQFRFHQKEKKLGFNDGDFNTLENLMNSAVKNTEIKCWAVRGLNDEIFAGAFFIKTKKRIIYLKGFSSTAGKKNGAMHFLFDRMISEYSQQDLILDFGGSNIDSVSRFYKSFAADDCLYLHLKINRLPGILKWLKR